MQSIYEKLMSRMSDELKPASLGRGALPKKLVKEKFGFRPFITISREPGSGGRPIAKKLAKLTKFKYYNKELLEKVAKNTKMRKKLVESIDEKGRTGIQDFVHSLFNPDYVSDVRYIRHLTNVLLYLSEKGNVILLGRGSNFITSPEYGLHVRVSAPYMVRVKRAIRHEKISEKQAKKIIKKVDADRKKFISQYFGKDISNANYYDLVLNTSYLSIDQAAQLILKAFELKFPRYLKNFKLRRKRIRK